MMKPRAIEVHIEELVLHGFDPKSRWQLSDALEQHLGELLSTQGLPPTWLSSPERIETATTSALPVNNASAMGNQIAGAIYRGEAK